MDIGDFLELVKNRRHNGRLKADPVPDELLEKILTAACWAPSGNNAQPWELTLSVVIASRQPYPENRSQPLQFAQHHRDRFRR